MTGIRPPFAGGTLSSEDQEVIDSIKNLPDGAVPKISNGKFVVSGQNVDPASKKFTFDESLSVPQASLGIGLVEQSESGSFLLTSSPIAPDFDFALLDSRFNDNGSFPPRYFNLVGKRTEDIQLTDTTVITTNPLTFSITTVLLAQTNKLTFKANGPMANISMKITDNASGEIIKHVPSRAAFDNGTGGIDLITGINVIDFISKLPSTPGVINIGLTPFRLTPSVQLDITIKGDTVDLKGDVTEFPFLTAEVQDAEFTELAILSQTGITEGFIPSVDIDGALIDSSIRENDTFVEVSKNVLLKSNYITKIPNLVGTTAQTLGTVEAYQKTSVTATATAKQFTAGDTAGPNIVLDSGTPVFSVGEFVLVENDVDNDGIYEVTFNLGAFLEFRGFGGVARVEDWTRDDVVTKIATVTITKINVSVRRTSLTGTIEHGEGDTAPITYFQLAHAADVPIIVVEEFAATEASFNSELGLPAAQGFTDSTAGAGTITLVSQNVFGVQKDTIKYNVPGDGDSAKSELALSGEDWDFMLANGFSFRGEGCKIVEDINTQSIFSGAGFSVARDPRPSSIQSRVGVFISEDGTNTTIRLDGQTVVALDGAGGIPLVPKDSYFDWEVFVDETPDAGVNFGAATMTVNGIQVVVGGIIASNNAVNDEVSVANSSSTGTTSFFFVNFGVTIYREGNVKTLAVATMQADIAQIKRPRGNRDHRAILPDGNPRKLGNRLEFLGGSAGTKLFLQTENPAAPQALFNGLNEVEINVVSNEPIEFVNTIENGNVYTGRSQILNQQSLGFAPGSINYDLEKGTMNVRNIFPGSSIQVGQENVVFVINNTGSTIPDGKVINISGYDDTSDAMEITLAIADTVENTEVLGITTTNMVDGAIGLVTVFGRVNDLDTTSFSAGAIVYLSSTSAGDLTATRPPIPIQMGHVGKIDASTGFIQVEIRSMEKSIFGGFSHTLDQTFTADVSAPISFNKNEEVSGIAHSETVNNDEFTFTSGGVYQATAEPQYTRTTGGGTDVLNMFFARDTGSGFVNVADSNVKFSVNTAGATTVSPLTITFRVDPGDKVRFMIQVEDVNLILDSFPASGSAPNDIPLTPSIIMNIVRIGD